MILRNLNASAEIECKRRNWMLAPKLNGGVEILHIILPIHAKKIIYFLNNHVQSVPHCMGDIGKYWAGSKHMKECLESIVCMSVGTNYFSNYCQSQSMDKLKWLTLTNWSFFQESTVLYIIALTRATRTPMWK